MKSESSECYLSEMISRFHFELVSGDMLAADAVLGRMIHLLDRLNIPSQQASAARLSLKQLLQQTDKTPSERNRNCVAILRNMPLVDRRYLN